MDKGIIAGCICPHPPLLVPDIGGRDIARVESTDRAMRELSILIGEMKPDVLVVISPHTPMMASSFTISTAKRLRGDFGQFGCPRVGLERPNDLELSEQMLALSSGQGVPLVARSRNNSELDHGVLVPLYFISSATDAPIVSLSISMLSYEKHAALGELVSMCCEQLRRRAVFVASGDLSHRLIPRAPAGFSPRGKDFDAAVARVVENGDFAGLASIEEDLVEEAGECGFRSIHTLSGALYGCTMDNRLLSYEGPFGVGYLVSVHLPVCPETEREQTDIAKLARMAIEKCVKEQEVLEPADCPGLFEAIEGRAGAFVSLKKNGRLRGCIGTFEPTRQNLAEEIVSNAISSCTRDPRFDPVTEDELERLDVSVDVLGEPEPIPDQNHLDPQRFGVIVKRGHRLGLLLPDLEGVDTVDEQVSIARQKAGIGPSEPVELFRFEVKRYK